MFTRKAQQTDAVEMYNLINNSYQKGFSSNTIDGKYVRYHSIEDLKKDLNKYRAMVLIDKIGTREIIVGTIFYSSDYKTQLSYFGTLCIKNDPKYKGKHLGNYLIKKAEMETLKDNRKELHILVLGSAKTLKAFYKRNGFVRTGVKEPLSKNLKSRFKPELQHKAYFVEMKKNVESASHANL